MAVVPDVQLFGKLNNILSESSTSAAVDAGSVEIALCGYGSQVPRVPSQAVLSQVTQGLGVTINATDQGTFTAYLFSNPLILPEGTYYTVTVKNFNGDIVQVNAYRFNAGGAYDLDGLQPYDPGQPPPPLPPLIISQLQIVPWSPSPFFDGSKFTAWMITLAGDTEGAQTVNCVPGNLYTFIILQDAVGGHQFWWPGQVNEVFNGTRVSPTPNTYTTQTFVALDNGSLYAIGPGTYSL